MAPLSAYGPNPNAGVDVNADHGWGGYEWTPDDSRQVPALLLGRAEYRGVSSQVRVELITLFELAYQIAREVHGYTIHTVDPEGSGESWGPWGYEDRPIAKTSTASNHSRGKANDWNAPLNPYSLNPFECDFPPAMVADIESIGLCWGGRYGDAMHWEYGYSPADVPGHEATAHAILRAAGVQARGSGAGSRPSRFVTDPVDRLALTIMQAAREVFADEGTARRAAVVGVCTAMAESGGLQIWANDGTSTLTGAAEGRQLNDDERAVARQSLQFPHDQVGHNLDSMGLFQQRPMAGWGAPAELMDPATSAAKFYRGAGGNRGLVDIAGWESLEPFEAGRRVQGSLPKDAPLYESYQPRAVEMVDRLWHTELATADEDDDDMIRTAIHFWTDDATHYVAFPPAAGDYGTVVAVPMDRIKTYLWILRDFHKVEVTDWDKLGGNGSASADPMMFGRVVRWQEAM